MKDKITLERIKLMHPNIRDEVNEIYDLIAQAFTGRAICRDFLIPEELIKNNIICTH